jgi:hypothetical protein
MGAQGKLADKRASLQDFIVELAILLGIAHINPRAEHADGSSVYRQRSLMAYRVDPSRQSADKHQPSCSKLSSQALRHLRPVQQHRRSSNPTRKTNQGLAQSKENRID